MEDKITRAVYKAIAEKVIEQLEWDATIGKYVLPEGFIFSIDAPIARIAAKDLGLSLPSTCANLNVDKVLSEVFENPAKSILRDDLTANLLKVIQRAELILDNQ
jgi:hypothetical protein